MNLPPSSDERERNTSSPRDAAHPADDTIEGAHEIGADEVHVWHGTVEEEAGGAAEDASALLPLVNRAEAARARSMGSDARGREFLACRVALRRILGEALAIAPLKVPIFIGAHGRPMLDDAAANPASLRFNLSHSGGRFMIALARELVPGVDIERVHAGRDLERLARRCFSPYERELFNIAPDPVHTFHRIWTRKEAVIKADGRGIAIGLARFDVDATEPPRLLRAEWRGAEENEAEQWSLFTLDAGEEHAAALAIRGQGFRLVLRHPFA